MKKIIAILLSAAMVIMMAAAVQAAEDGEDLPAEADAAAQTETETAAEEETAADEIEGFYILNYSQIEDKVNLNMISESDLTAASAQADTVIYQFGDDGSCVVYDRGEVSEGTYQYEDGKLEINAGEDTLSYEYEFIDSLLVIRADGESSILYGFELEDTKYITIEDYSEIKLDMESLTLTEEDVDAYIESVLDAQTVSEEIREGTTKTGDIITISFEGILEGEEEPFEGGSSQGLTFQLGSGALVADFEDQLTGKEIGSTFDVVITFPEDYPGDPSLIGKTATFETTILFKTELTVPELTDEWVQEFTKTYLTEQIDTVEEFREYCRAFEEESILHAAIFNELANRSTITGYNGTVAQLLLNYASLNLSSMAEYYGLDTATYAAKMGYESESDFVQQEASSYITSAMIINKILVDLGIRYTNEELEAALSEYVRSGFGDTMTVEEYKTQVGTLGIWAYTNMVFKYDLAMKALEDRVS